MGDTNLDRRTIMAATVALAAAAATRSEASERSRSFPRNFLWGAATAGHQIEGNNTNADMWVTEHVTPTYFREPSGDACDSLHRWPEDLGLVREIGLSTYRFSIEWSRIEPAEGQFSQAYLDYYSRILDGCLERRILPFVTFNHFTAPVWFAAKGHWASPDASDLFARFCEKAARALADRMAYAATLNEPNSMRLVQWLAGPRMPANLRQAVDAASARAVGATAFGNFLMNEPDRYLEQTLAGHAKGFQAIKAVRSDLPVGVCLAVEDEQIVGDGEAARTAKRHDVYGRWFEAARTHGDFIGVQTYTRRLYGPDGPLPAPEGAEMAQMGMEYYPPALGHCVRFAHEQTGKPVFVTENGIGTADDEQRCRYIPLALAGLKEAIDGGVPVIGYLHWSLIDNFEWMMGYGAQYGLASVDRTSFVRTLKPSARVLGRIARANALS